MQAKAHGNGSVDPVHHGAVDSAHVLPQTLFVQGADLLQQNHRVLGQTKLAGCQGNVGGQLGLSRLGGNGRGNDSGAVTVARVVLHDEHRAHAPLFTAHHGAQVCIKDISTLYAMIHKSSHSAGSRILRHQDAIASYETRSL